MNIPPVFDIERTTLENDNFRWVIYTNSYIQLAVMSLLPYQDIGSESHNVDQFIRIERGTGYAIINDKIYDIADNSVINIPRGTKHNIINNTSKKMKLYTIYSPPNEEPGLVQQFKN